MTALVMAFVHAAAAAILLPQGGWYVFLGLIALVGAAGWLFVADADIRLARSEERRGR